MADSYVNTQAPLGQKELAQPIRITTNNLASMAARGVDYMRHVAASSPVQLDRLFHVKTGADADMALMAVPRLATYQKIKTDAAKGTMVQSLYARGDVVFDTEHGKKVTVLKVAVGYTKLGRPIHRVADKAGNAWLVSEKRLQRI